MAGPITTIAAAITKNLTVAGVTLTDGAVLLGEENLHADSSPPRVVMIPRTEAWGDRDAADRTRNAYVYSPLFTRLVNFETHLWGADYDSTEDLLNQVIRAAHVATAGIIGVERGRWNTDSELAKLGREYVVEITIAVPVTSAAATVQPGGTITPIIEPSIT